MKLQNIFFTIFVCLSAKILAQGTGYRYINFGKKDGLYDNLFYTATQDNLGFVWIGSGSGLYKYDGIRFKKTNSPINSSANTIASFLLMVNKDNSGNLWLGSLSSLQWMQPTTQKFWQPPLTPENTAMMKAQIHQTFFGKYAWLATYKNYFYRFNEKDSSFISFASKYPPESNPLVYRVFEYKNYVLALHPNGVYCFTINGDFVKFIPFNNNEISNGVLVEEENCLLITSYSNGLYKFDLDLFTFIPVIDKTKAQQKNILLSLYRKKNGDVLMGGYGLFKYDTKANIILSDTPGKEKNDYDLKVTKIGSFLEDKEHNIWVCSHFGLSMIPWQNNQITTNTIKDPSNNAGTEIIKIYKSPIKDEHFITTTAANGLLIYKNGIVNSIPNKYEAGSSIKFLFYRKDGKIFATDYKQFYELDYIKKTLTPVQLKDQNNKLIYCPKYFAESNNSVLYMGSKENGFYKWDYRKNNFTHYSLLDIDKESSDNNILPMFADSKNNIWFVSNNGVYVHNVTTGNYNHITHYNENNTAVLGKCLNVTEDNNHHIWVLSEGNGFFEFIENKDGGYIVNHETSANNKSFRGDAIWDIEKDNSENILWLSTTEGLARFNPVTKQMYGAYSMQNGMKETGGGYSFEQSGNKLFQIFYSTINTIDKDTYQWNKYAPKPIITSFKVVQSERILKLDSIASTVTLNASENYIEIEYVGLCLNNSNNNKYYHRLVGLEKDWEYADDKNIVKYSDLKPGKYTFEVKYLNNDGAESPVQQIFITIKKPFYLQWWFIGLLLLTLLGFLYAWNRYKIAQTQKEEKIKADFQQQIAQTEMKALRAQMNPHFIFNSLNSIQKYILKNEHFEASQYLTKFSRLIRLILDHSNQNTILLSSELDLLRLYIEMESLRFDNSFTYNINVDDNINTATMLIPSMLIQPYIENAIWHGLLHKEDKGHLILAFHLANKNCLQVEIEDNGVGREKAMQLKSKQVLKKKSYGMQITENRIAIINKTMNINATLGVVDLKDNNGNASGTKVILNIPLQTITQNIQQ